MRGRMPQLSHLFIGLGLLMAVVGLVLQFAPGLLTWFGRLPGDVAYRGESVRLYVPITSMILLNLILWAIFGVFGRR